MRVILLSSSLIFYSVCVIAQQPIEQKTETRVIIRDGGGLPMETPLVIIDGKPGGDLKSISPDAILKVDVLKGNSAYQLYGDEGKNGVVVITTKSGALKDTMPGSTQKTGRIVTVNTFRMRDGVKDTTIVRADSMTVNIEDDRIIVNGSPTEDLRLPWGGSKDVRILLEDLKDGKMFWLEKEVGNYIFDKRAPKLGMSVQEVADGKGLLVLSVVSTGAAAKAGVLADDRILTIDEKAVNDVDALKEAIAKARDKRSIMIHLQRGKKEIHLELVFPRELKKADL